MLVYKENNNLANRLDYNVGIILNKLGEVRKNNEIILNGRHT